MYVSCVIGCTAMKPRVQEGSERGWMLVTRVMLDRVAGSTLTAESTTRLERCVVARRKKTARKMDRGCATHPLQRITAR
jgi:hypothetical protein